MSSVFDDIALTANAVVAITAVASLIVTVSKYKKLSEKYNEEKIDEIVKSMIDGYITSGKFKEMVNDVIATNTKINDIDKKLSMLILLLCQVNGNLKDSMLCKNTS